MPPKKTATTTKTATKTGQKPATISKTGPGKTPAGSLGAKKGVGKSAVSKTSLAAKKTSVSPTKEKTKGKNEGATKTKVWFRT